jgi:PAS domain-containing protein
MDGVTSKPAFVAEALALIAAPACACDAQGMVWSANAAMIELAGGEVDGRSLPELFHVPAVAAAEVRLALAGERRWSGILAGGLEARAVEVRARPLPLATGSAGATFVFTELQMPAEAQAGLRARLLEQATVLEHAPVGIVVTLPHLVKSCNPRMADMLGYSVEQLVDSNPADIFLTPAACEAFVKEAVAVLAAACSKKPRSSCAAATAARSGAASAPRRSTCARATPARSGSSRT